MLQNWNFNFFTIQKIEKTTGVPFLETAQIIVDDLGLPITAIECDRLFEECKPPRESILMPGAERLIKHLHSSGIPLAIATGSSKASFQWKSAPHQDLFALFHHVLNVPDEPEVTRGKPDPLPYIVAAKRFSPDFPVTDRQNVLVFEDAIAGIKSANAAGMRSIWVPDPRMPEELTKEVGPFRRLPSLEHFRPEEFGLSPFSTWIFFISTKKVIFRFVLHSFVLSRHRHAITLGNHVNGLWRISVKSSLCGQR